MNLLALLVAGSLSVSVPNYNEFVGNYQRDVKVVRSTTIRDDEDATIVKYSIVDGYMTYTIYGIWDMDTCDEEEFEEGGILLHNGRSYKSKIFSIVPTKTSGIYHIRMRFD